LTLINTNRMRPPIAPIGLAYTAAAARRAGVEVDVLDPYLSDRPEEAIEGYFADHDPELIGLSFRNVDDCFWPSGASFVPQLTETVARLRKRTDAPIVLGGVGFSIFPQRILELSGADFGICGDGEQAVVSLLRQLQGRREFQKVEGLLWRADDGRIVRNRPAWPSTLDLPGLRDVIDNAAYFDLGGQGGVETKRGCDRACSYCADRLAKGTRVRMRRPKDIADEVESLLGQGVDVLHLCDGEFNIPRAHALAVCQELTARRLGQRVRWYAYMAVVPFDAELASAMRRAGCVGIDFTGDSASSRMLSVYNQPHSREDLAAAARLCRDSGITVMFDLLLGGPGETPETLAETIRFVKAIEPDCVGAALGVRLWPGLAMLERVSRQGPLESNPGIRRHYPGPIDLLRPTFYISPALGDRPAALVRDLIGRDERFFPPADQADASARAQQGHNYNDNDPLVRAIAGGARGAYWDILRKFKQG